MKSARQISPLERQALAGEHTPSEPSDSAFKFQMCENTQLKVTFKFTTPVLRVKSLSTINQNGDQEINKASCVAPGMKSARQISPLERQALAGGHTPSEPSDSA